MIKKIFLMLILFMLLSINVKASTISKNSPTPTYSNVYTEGFYRFDNSSIVDISITLITDTPTKIIILDENMNIQFMTQVPYNYKFTLRNIEPNKMIGIVGEGEVAISFEKVK